MAPSGVAGRQLVRNLKTIRDTPVDDRRKAVEAVMSAAADTQAIQVAVDEIKQASSFLLYSSALLLMLVFVLLPVSLLTRVSLPWLRVEATLIGVVYLLVVALWWRTHRTLLPEEPGDRLEELLVFFFFPVSAMHAFGKLSRRLLVPFDSLALTVVFEPERAEEVLKREYIRKQAAAGFGGGADLEAMWGRKICLLETLAQEGGIGLSGSGVQPDAEDGEMVCPLCSATYRDGVETCADCLISLTRVGTGRVDRLKQRDLNK
jgi:hypothetical protein